jgi:hypothetical protein
MKPLIDDKKLGLEFEFLSSFPSSCDWKMESLDYWIHWYHFLPESMAAVEGNVFSKSAISANISSLPE